MARTSPPITIQEIPGKQFPDLESAQRSARAYIAYDLASLLRSMLDAGTLEIRDGLIIPKG